MKKNPPFQSKCPVVQVLHQSLVHASSCSSSDKSKAANTEQHPKRRVQTPSVYSERPRCLLSAVFFFGPVVYCNALIDVYLCCCCQLQSGPDKPLSLDFPGIQLLAVVSLSACVCFRTFCHFVGQVSTHRLHSQMECEGDRCLQHELCGLWE